MVRLLEKSALLLETASNPATSPDVLTAIARKSSTPKTVLEAVAKNPNTPPEILEAFACLPNKYDTAYGLIRRAVLNNPNASGKALGFILLMSHGYFIPELARVGKLELAIRGLAKEQGLEDSDNLPLSWVLELVDMPAIIQAKVEKKLRAIR